MRKNRTSGSVRGSRQAFHVYKYPERSVETVYSTRAMSLGTNICRLRTANNLSQGELAEALGVSRQSVSKWETDASVPELDKLVKLASLFGVTLDQLVTGETPPIPEPSPAPPQ